MSLKQRVRNLEKRFCVSKPTPPIIFRVVKAGARDRLGQLIHPSEPDDSVRCTCNGNDYDRLPGETVEDFTDRVLSLQPKEDGKLTILVLLPRPDGKLRIAPEASSSDKQRPSSNELTSPPENGQ
jgi:hypothetical protein